MASEASLRTTVASYRKSAHGCCRWATFYNFVRIHKSLRVTPAMAAGLTDRLWEMRDIVALVEAAEAAEGPKKRGPYRKRQAAA